MYCTLFGFELFIERTAHHFGGFFEYLHDAQGEATALLFGKWRVALSW